MADFTNAGQKAAEAGIPILEPTEDKVRNGADEINITRDWIAILNPGLREINCGMGPPAGDRGEDGDIYIGVV